MSNILADQIKSNYKSKSISWRQEKEKLLQAFKPKQSQSQQRSRTSERQSKIRSLVDSLYRQPTPDKYPQQQKEQREFKEQKELTLSSIISHYQKHVLLDKEPIKNTNPMANQIIESFLQLKKHPKPQPEIQMCYSETKIVDSAHKINIFQRISQIKEFLDQKLTGDNSQSYYQSEISEIRQKSVECPRESYKKDDFLQRIAKLKQIKSCTTLDVGVQVEFDNFQITQNQEPKFYKNNLLEVSSVKHSQLQKLVDRHEEDSIQQYFFQLDQNIPRGSQQIARKSFRLEQKNRGSNSKENSKLASKENSPLKEQIIQTKVLISKQSKIDENYQKDVVEYEIQQQRYIDMQKLKEAQQQEQQVGLIQLQQYQTLSHFHQINEQEQNQEQDQDQETNKNAMHTYNDKKQILKEINFQIQEQEQEYKQEENQIQQSEQQKEQNQSYSKAQQQQKQNDYHSIQSVQSIQLDQKDTLPQMNENGTILEQFEYRPSSSISNNQQLPEFQESQISKKEIQTRQKIQEQEQLEFAERQLQQEQFIKERLEQQRNFEQYSQRQETIIESKFDIFREQQELKQKQQLKEQQKKVYTFSDVPQLEILPISQLTQQQDFMLSTERQQEQQQLQNIVTEKSIQEPTELVCLDNLQYSEDTACQRINTSYNKQQSYAVCDLQQMDVAGTQSSFEQWLHQADAKKIINFNCQSQYLKKEKCDHSTQINKLSDDSDSDEEIVFIKKKQKEVQLNQGITNLFRKISSIMKMNLVKSFYQVRETKRQRKRSAVECIGNLLQTIVEETGSDTLRVISNLKSEAVANKPIDRIRQASYYQNLKPSKSLQNDQFLLYNANSNFTTNFNSNFNSQHLPSPVQEINDRIKVNFIQEMGLESPTQKNPEHAEFNDYSPIAEPMEFQEVSIIKDTNKQRQYYQQQYSSIKKSMHADMECRESSKHIQILSNHIAIQKARIGKKFQQIHYKTVGQQQQQRYQKENIQY